MAASASSRAVALLKEIEDLRGRLSAVLDELVTEQRRDAPGVPDVSIRLMITRGDYCLCGVVERILRAKVDA